MVFMGPGAGRVTCGELRRIEEGDRSGIEGHHGASAAGRNRGAASGTPAGAESGTEPEPGQNAGAVSGDDEWRDRHLSGGDGHDAGPHSEGTSVVRRGEHTGTGPQ